MQNSVKNKQKYEEISAIQYYGRLKELFECNKLAKISKKYLNLSILTTGIYIEFITIYISVIILTIVQYKL